MYRQVKTPLVFVSVISLLQKIHSVLERCVQVPRSYQVYVKTIKNYIIIFVAIDFIFNVVSKTLVHVWFPCHFILILNLIVHLQRLKGKWQARIWRVAGNKDLYLGSFGKFLLVSIYMWCRIYPHFGLWFGNVRVNERYGYWLWQIQKKRQPRLMMLLP